MGNRSSPGTAEQSPQDKTPCRKINTAPFMKGQVTVKSNSTYLSLVVEKKRFMMTLRYDNLKYVLHCFLKALCLKFRALSNPDKVA